MSDKMLSSWFIVSNPSLSIDVGVGAVLEPPEFFERMDSIFDSHLVASDVVRYPFMFQSVLTSTSAPRSEASSDMPVSILEKSL